MTCPRPHSENPTIRKQLQLLLHNPVTALKPQSLCAILSA